jgi:hypothetical protein
MRSMLDVNGECNIWNRERLRAVIRLGRVFTAIRQLCLP